MKGEVRDLRERTTAFALRSVRMYAALPKNGEAQVLGRQVLRSATSVGANYREAFRGRSRAEFFSKCGDSLRELEETSYWFELLVESRIVATPKLSALRQECAELIAIFAAILKHAKKPAPGNNPKAAPATSTATAGPAS